MKEDGEVSDQDTAMSEQKPDQQLYNEQNDQETARGALLFKGR